MQTRTVNIAKYREIKESGVLGDENLKLYEVLLVNGPLTRGECWELFRQSTGQNLSRHGFVSRMSLLQRRGLIDKVAADSMRKKCQVTGTYSYVWDVTPA